MWLISEYVKIDTFTLHTGDKPRITIFFFGLKLFTLISLNYVKHTSGQYLKNSCVYSLRNLNVKIVKIWQKYKIISKFLYKPLLTTIHS